jgi:hypothetical protein
VQVSLITAFNSGRGYTQHGQRISVWLIESDQPGFIPRVAMIDIDRGIDYVFDDVYVGYEGLTLETLKVEMTQGRVMALYDNNRTQGFPFDLWCVRDELLRRASTLDYTGSL